MNITTYYCYCLQYNTNFSTSNCDLQENDITSFLYGFANKKNKKKIIDN